MDEVQGEKFLDQSELHSETCLKTKKQTNEQQINQEQKANKERKYIISVYE